MPVSSISVFGSRSAKAGALRWIGQRSVISSVDSSAFRNSPSALKTWPRVTSPTGTEMPAPVS